MFWHHRVRNWQYFLTYSMEQSPTWEANWFAASQEIPRILWDPKVHYFIHKCLPPVPILSQLDTVHTPTSHFLKIHLNITLPSAPGSSQWSLSLRFPHQNPVHTSPLPPHTRYTSRPSHYSLFYHPNNTGWAVQIINPLTPNDPHRGRTAPLNSKRCILYIYSTNIGTKYFKHSIYSQFFPLQNAVCFIILTYLVPVLFTFHIQVC